MARFLTLVRWMLAAVGIVSAAAAAGAALAGQAGRWSALLDVSNHFAGLWGPIGLGAALLSAAAARGAWARMGVALGLLAATVAAALIVPEMIARGRHAPADDRPTLKIVQFNTWGRNTDPERTLAWILAQDADLVLTEESYRNARSITKTLRRTYPHWSSCGVPHGCSVMLYSREPILERGSGEGPPLAWATIDWTGRPVTVAAIHAYWPYPPGFQKWQFERLARFVNARDQASMILAGDFNAAPWSFALKRLDDATALERRTHGIPTWPAASVSRYQIPTLFPVLPIDQVYAGRAWRTVSVERGPRLGSDHYPVVVVLAPRD